MSSQLNLLPQPRSLVMGDGMTSAQEPTVRTDPSLPAEGYELTIATDGISLAAADAAGEFYGRATLAQLAQQGTDGVPVCTIRDWPDLPVRGVMLDIARDKVPTLDTLKDLVARLASWKVNQVQLYIEHTFAYRGHDDVWLDASALTPDEVRELDAWCRDRHVELVPNQNCLGHMGRWLRHARYLPLAMTPEGFTDYLGRRRGPMTIEPSNPASLALVRDLLSQLLPCFTSSRVHVGLDEPWELPEERIGDYLDWVDTLCAVPELDGREVLVWGDILAGKPEHLARLPEHVTVCEWGYEDWSPFDERAATFAASGTRFWICPGTSSWMTILGRTTNMKGDCVAAAAALAAHGGTGFLNTDWGDQGHLQYLPVSEPGFAYGAAVSWCLETNRDLDLAAALDVHAFDDTAGVLGNVLLGLGDLYRAITPQFPNISALVLHLYYPQLKLGRGPTAGVTPEELAAVEGSLDDALGVLGSARPQRTDGTLVLDELRAAITLVSLLCRDGRARLAGDGTLASIPEDTRRELATELGGITETHRELWLARNRPGGLEDSVSWLAHLQRCYETGEAPMDWGSHYVG
ncbi:MAG: glycoside hydrolase family 20 zincin-like fold domain-containing protein [Acidimicrobiia bacterium]